MKIAGISDTAAIIDLSRKEGTVERLTESKITCTTEDKDLYLYYFLLVSCGRKLIFTNSLTCLYRLKSLLEMLKLHPLPLHAKMQQRQRLKNLDKLNIIIIIIITIMIIIILDDECVTIFIDLLMIKMVY
jgi:ATP-dependent RNA helicase DDX24/MAK5